MNSQLEDHVPIVEQDASDAAPDNSLERKFENCGLDTIWLTAEYLFQLAYVTALLDVERVVDQPIEAEWDIEATIDFIETAREYNEYSYHFVPTPFRKPSAEDLRLWRAAHDGSNIVHEARDWDLTVGVYDLARLRTSIGCCSLWFRVCDEVVLAIAKSARIIDPKIYALSSEDEIQSIVDHLIIKRGFRSDFRPNLYSISINLLREK